MSEIYPALVQRPVLLAMAERLDSRASALRRDECSDWRINGLDGHIYAVPEGFQFVVFKQGLRGWNVAKYRLAFCTVTQDGDTEGAFILDRLPSRAEAEIIRAVLRIPKRRHLSEAQREIATERLARARLNAQKPASPVPAVNWYRPGNSRPS